MPARVLSTSLRLGVAATTLGVLALGAGCRGDRTDSPPRQFFPDMDDQAKYKSQAESTFFADGRTMREPVSGTVAFARTSEILPLDAPGERASWQSQAERERADLLREDVELYTGKSADGAYLALVPMPVTAELIRRGQERFNIYCTPCHGYTGDGKGMVGQQWSYDVPSFLDPKYAFGSDDPDGRGTDGFIFHTIRNGVPNAPGVMPLLKMPAYREQVDERDAWAIVAYIRAIQRSQKVPIDDVPERYKPELDRTRAGAAPAPTAVSLISDSEGDR